MVGKGLIRLLLAPFERFYPTAKLLYNWRLAYEYRHFEKGPLLVLQMGKVGSRSLQSGLNKQVSDRPVYHAHFLSPDRVARTEADRKEYFRTYRHRWVTRQWRSQFLLRRWEAATDDRTWKIITMVREPVGRNISAFFENFYYEAGEKPGEFEFSSHYYKVDPETITVDDTPKLSEMFYRLATHDSPLVFFDREIKDIFGIDVIGAGFPVEKGYEIYKADRVELLVIRLEDVSRVVSTAIEEFLGIPGFELESRNVGADKIYAPLYEAFKSNVVIDSAYAEKLLDSDYSRTFYSDEEIRAAKRKWLKE